MQHLICRYVSTNTFFTIFDVLCMNFPIENDTHINSRYSYEWYSTGNGSFRLFAPRFPGRGVALERTSSCSS